MSALFEELIRQSRHISADEFACDFGGIGEDVVAMLESPEARVAQRAARAYMESGTLLPSGRPRLRQMQFGRLDDGPELLRGEVAAIDGTNMLPLQRYSAGQALCVGVGSLSHQRALQQATSYWSARVRLGEAASADEFVRRKRDGIFGISATAYLRYWEIRSGLEVPEPFLLFDGTLIYEWLVSSTVGNDLYDALFDSGKRCLGVMKSLKETGKLGDLARALRPGELFIAENVLDHLEHSQASNKNPGEAGPRYALQRFLDGHAPHIMRGIFKPGTKTFGFEVHEDHLEDMVRIMAADCQVSYPGHEIPYLLNAVDQAVRSTFRRGILRDHIAASLVGAGEDVFFEESDERDFR